MTDLVAVLTEWIEDILTGRGAPVFVGLDGRSGAGKSTLAAAAASRLREHGHSGVSVIEGDQFYAGGSATAWDQRSASEKVDRGIDWRRQRAVLEDLRELGRAEWRSFDWEADDWDAAVVPLAATPITAAVGSVAILEGAYSCRPELHRLLDLRVLLDTPRDVRRARLLEREGEEYRDDWEARWSVAEDHYFGTLMTPDRFDLVL
jgi:uridine kinase